MLVKAITPERDACEIRFPRVEGYRVELPEERLDAEFDDDETLELTPKPRRLRPLGLLGADRRVRDGGGPRGGVEGTVPVGSRAGGALTGADAESAGPRFVPLPRVTGAGIH